MHPSYETDMTHGKQHPLGPGGLPPGDLDNFPRWPSRDWSIGACYRGPVGPLQARPADQTQPLWPDRYVHTDVVWTPYSTLVSVARLVRPHRRGVDPFVFGHGSSWSTSTAAR